MKSPSARAKERGRLPFIRLLAAVFIRAKPELIDSLL